MMTLADIVSRAEEVAAELAELVALETLDEEQEARFAELDAETVELDKARKGIEARQATLERAQRASLRPENLESGDGARDGAPQYMKRTETDIQNVRSAAPSEVRDAALAILDREARSIEMRDDAVAQVDRMLRSKKRDPETGDIIFDGDEVARRLVSTSRPAYLRAFQKVASGPMPIFDGEEAEAYSRAQSEGTTTAGGFAIPVLIDPTIVMTTGAADVPILRVARVETITTNVWKGVTGAPVAWSYDAEATAVSDDAITIAQPVVTTYKTAAYVPYSIEVGQDWPGFAAEMTKAIEQGYLDKIAAATMTGSGSSEPFGIFTAIDANAAREVVVTTSGSLSAIDVLRVWNALGERFRPRSSWFSSVSVESKVRVPATDIAGLYTVDLTAEGLGRVNGRPYYTSDYAPAFTATTGTVNLAVLGDFQHYVIAQRAGMNVELVPHVFDVTNNRPTGQRGWYAWARHGADSIVDEAFVLLKNAT